MIAIRPMTESDLAAACLLWSKSEGVELAEGDSVDALKAYLRRNPDVSHVAVDGSAVVGAVLAGYDGRRGFLYHLAVSPAHQRGGIGKKLVDQSLAALRTRGIARVLILVARDNASGVAFWRKCGWDALDFAQPMGIDLGK